ncbi:MAG: NuoI/complex I 23 kDa subunit family protein [Symbiobacteriia bacterium]
MSYWSKVWNGAKSTSIGLGVTLKEFFQDPITLQYPDEMPNLPGWSRAVPLQKTDMSTGAYKCTACGLCEQACPVDTIHIESHQDPVTKKKFIDVYEIDMSRCMLCNYCVEACPFDALVMGNDFEQAADNTDEMVYDFDKLLRLGLEYSKPEEQAVKSNNVGGGLPDWVFAQKTGATLADMPEGVELGKLSCFEVDFERKQAAAKAKAAEASKAATEAAAKPVADGAAKPAAEGADSAKGEGDAK